MRRDTLWLLGLLGLIIVAVAPTGVTGEHPWDVDQRIATDTFIDWDDEHRDPGDSVIVDTLQVDLQPRNPVAPVPVVSDYFRWLSLWFTISSVAL